MPITRTALILGYAGLLPQSIALAMAWHGGQWGYVGLAGGFAYAALIFSFLGGVWWGQALSAGKADALSYLLAVMPSLIGLALFLPWTFGWVWPDQQLIILGSLIAFSPLVDRSMGLSHLTFLRLRWYLSLGLGALTIAIGVVGLDPA